MLSVGLQECQIVLVVALLIAGGYRLPDMARGLAEAVPELSHADAVLAALLGLAAVAALGLDLDTVGRTLERSLRVLTGTWR
jgi:hypothetical protein